MPLFHPRIVQKGIREAGDVPEAHLRVLSAWTDNLADGVYDSETQNDAEFIQRILVEILGYSGSSSGKEWTVAKNQPVGSGNVDVALGHFSSGGSVEIHAPFELKGARTRDLDAIMSGRNKTPVQQAWEYGMDAKGAKWVLVSNYRQIRLYAIGYGRQNYEAFDLATMARPENYHRFMLLLSADNLLSGATLRLLLDSDAAEKEITKQLYEDYKGTRLVLINEIIESGQVEALTAVRLAQTILDRVLFIAFAEDRGLLKPATLKEAFEIRNPYSPQPAWDNYKGLFNAIDKGSVPLNIPGYNGGLFATDKEIDDLVISDATCSRLADLSEYDYDSDVSVNILGHVFEQSITDIEDIKHSLDPDSLPTAAIESKRRTDGIFYTPPFITRHIVEQAVGKWLDDRKTELGINRLKPLNDADYASIKTINRGPNKGQVTFNENVRAHVKLWEAYRDRLSSIKVVDPACGSGAFLNEVFDFLYREGQVVNRTLETLYGGQINLFRWDSHILANNIYGVDINRESVEITKLSLWLKTANRNEKLSYLDDNIMSGNSLVNVASIAGDLAFDWRERFKSIMDSGGFDVVVGNPPYVDSEAMAKAWPREREYITATFQQARGNWDLYVAFLELGCNLLADHGYLSYITPDKWISKDFGTEIRKRVLPGIVSILPVGRAVFESALVDSIVTTVGKAPADNLQIMALVDGEATIATEVPKRDLDGTDGFDQLISTHYLFIRKLEKVAGARLKDFAPAENACATSDTYVLGEILEDAGSIHGYDPTVHYKVANTGTLDQYVFRWGTRPMRYLKKDYAFPVVAKTDFNARLGATYRRRSASPKLIVKGLTLLDGALDLAGEYVPGKSTLVICSEVLATLKFVAGIVNSRFASFYVKQKYASASYNGGVNFTPDMLDSIPIPAGIDQERIIKHVEIVTAAQEKRMAITSKLHGLIRASVGDKKLGRKLDAWQNLTAKQFVDELARQGLPLSITQRGEWIDIFDQHKALIGKTLTECADSERAIDDLLFDAFSLNEAERDYILA